MQKQSGFTLIELIVVIVILGILAAFAVPRFVGMQEEARTSTVKGLKGSLRGAASMAHGKAMVNNTAPPPSVTTGTYTIKIQGKNVEYIAQSTWPAGTEGGIKAMMQDTGGFVPNSESSSCIVNGTTVANNISAKHNCITFYPEGTANPENCYVAYGTNGSAPNIYPFYTNSTADCS